MIPPAPTTSAAHLSLSAWPCDEEQLPAERQEPPEERQASQPAKTARQDTGGGAAQLLQSSREDAELPGHQEGEQGWEQDRLDPSDEGEEQGGYLSEGWDTDDYDPTTWGELTAL